MEWGKGCAYSHKILDQLQQLCGGSRCWIATGHTRCGLLQRDGQTRHQLVHMVIQLSKSGKEMEWETERENDCRWKPSRWMYKSSGPKLGHSIRQNTWQSFNDIASGRFQLRLLLQLGMLPLMPLLLLLTDCIIRVSSGLLITFAFDKAANLITAVKQASQRNFRSSQLPRAAN